MIVDAAAGQSAVGSGDPIAAEPGRATRAVVDLDAYAGNVRAILASLTPGTRLMAAVKANGYGHGAAMIARTAVGAGASQLAVATVEEGVQLRAAGLVQPILVLGPIDPTEVAHAVRHDLSLTVADRVTLDLIADAANDLSPVGSAAVHVKVDTGMRRYGARSDLAVTLAELVDASPLLRLEGLSTHFAASDDPDESFTAEQAARFDRCVAEVRARGIGVPLLHAANSAAALRWRRYDYDMVRIGIASYGLAPSADVRLLPTMRPAMTLRSRVARVMELAPGDTVSYGRTYQAARPERVAVVPIGYADGYPRALSGLGRMSVRGRAAEIRGRICMDQTVVAVGDNDDVAIGDEVVVVGDGSDAAPTLTELADLTGTLNYELASRVAVRVPRMYVRDGRVVAVEDTFGLREVADVGKAG